MKESFIFFFICISLLNSLSNCLIQENYTILNISITTYYFGCQIGKTGALSFGTDFNDKEGIFDPLDIEEKTKFTATIFNETNEYDNINCRLWKFRDEYLNVFCYLDETIPKGIYEIFFKSCTFNYKDYDINFKSIYNITFRKLDIYSIDLYSNLQNIVVEDSKDSYELKFKINAYDNQELILGPESSDKIAKFDNCKVEGNELKCQILKIELERILKTNEEDFYLYYLEQKSGYENVQLVNKIVVKYNNLNKTNIFVRITKLIENTAEDDDSCIAYETNVTNISNIYTSLDGFEIQFVGSSLHCSFIKYQKTPLLIVCRGKSGVQCLGKIV